MELQNINCTNRRWGDSFASGHVKKTEGLKSYKYDTVSKIMIAM